MRDRHRTVRYVLAVYIAALGLLWVAFWLLPGTADGGQMGLWLLVLNVPASLVVFPVLEMVRHSLHLGMSSNGTVVVMQAVLLMSNCAVIITAASFWRRRVARGKRGRL